MKYIDFDSLKNRLESLKGAFNDPKKPFRYIMLEGFFKPEMVELIHDNYPALTDGDWGGITYLNQNNKFARSKFEKETIFDEIMAEMNSEEFRKWLENISGIEGILGDDELLGAGLHQSVNGAFLNVHVDYNVHPTTKYHRRMNVLIYMNKEWKDEYEGHLELWDLTGGKMNMIEKIAPTLNRCVIFETTEISFHGHPKPLNTPPGINRKSIAAYYYSVSRPENEVAAAHNTIYVNTEGAAGSIKRLNSGVKAFLERINIKKD